jgi:hypothetical protein
MCILLFPHHDHTLSVYCATKNFLVNASSFITRHVLFAYAYLHASYPSSGVVPLSFVRSLRLSSARVAVVIHCVVHTLPGGHDPISVIPNHFSLMHVLTMYSWFLLSCISVQVRALEWRLLATPPVLGPPLRLRSG